METFIFFMLGFGYLCLLISGLFLAAKHGLFNPNNVLLLIILGLLYDNFIIASGRFIGEGDVLEKLSHIRFWLHALFTPTLILFAWHTYVKTGLPRTKNTSWKVLAYALTIGLIIYELFSSVKGLQLEPVWKNSVLTYESVHQSAVPVMVILITLVLGTVGLLLMIKFRFYWLLIGVLIMITGSILTNWMTYYPMMNILEFFLIISVTVTSRNLSNYI